jgi:hypothetical protein
MLLVPVDANTFPRAYCRSSHSGWVLKIDIQDGHGGDVWILMIVAMLMALTRFVDDIDAA